MYMNCWAQFQGDKQGFWTELKLNGFDHLEKEDDMVIILDGKWEPVAYVLRKKISFLKKI